jgi:hypothetical protein
MCIWTRSACQAGQDAKRDSSAGNARSLAETSDAAGNLHFHCSNRTPDAGGARATLARVTAQRLSTKVRKHRFEHHPEEKRQSAWHDRFEHQRTRAAKVDGRSKRHACASNTLQITNGSTHYRVSSSSW